MTDVLDGFAFDCPICKMRHVGLPAVGYADPAPCVEDDDTPMPFTRIGRDFRIAGDRHFFVRTVLCVPIIGQRDGFEWGVWASLSKPNFDRYRDSFDRADQSDLGGMFSYLSNEIGGYPGSHALRAAIYPQDGNQRPLMVIATDQDHPLVHDQSNGITPERAIELILPSLHSEGTA